MNDLPDEPRISVVICTYDSDLYEHFRDAADSVLAQTYEAVELVIVVDGSQLLFERISDQYEHRENVVLHLNDSNVGLLKSRNRGVERATGDIVAFLDDDAVADEQWLEELHRTYHRTDCDAAGGRIVPRWEAEQPVFLPEEFYWLIGVTHRGFADGPEEVRNTFGSNLSFRRSVFLDLGGFDVDIGGRKGDKNLQGGETELCARLRQKTGHGVQYNPDAIVAHKVFSFRTDPRWLAERAFWQGYSKRAMAVLVPESSAEEGDFLSRLLTEFLVDRLSDLVWNPSKSGFAKFVTLIVLTGIVGSGYLYGVLRYPPFSGD